jgi:hypothetical protein
VPTVIKEKWQGESSFNRCIVKDCLPSMGCAFNVAYLQFGCDASFAQSSNLTRHIRRVRHVEEQRGFSFFKNSAWATTALFGARGLPLT